MINQKNLQSLMSYIYGFFFFVSLFLPCSLVCCGFQLQKSSCYLAGRVIRIVLSGFECARQPVMRCDRLQSVLAVVFRPLVRFFFLSALRLNVQAIISNRA